MKKLELEGIIEIGDGISFHCCESYNDILINGESLTTKLDNFFEVETNGNIYNYSCGENDRDLCKLQYVILTDYPDVFTALNFEYKASIIINQMLYSDYKSGCYSEWTCGYGGFDYLLNQSNHSIFSELASSEGLYLHMVLTNDKK